MTRVDSPNSIAPDGTPMLSPWRGRSRFRNSDIIYPGLTTLPVARASVHDGGSPKSRRYC